MESLDEPQQQQQQKTGTDGEEQLRGAEKAKEEHDVGEEKQEEDEGEKDNKERQAEACRLIKDLLYDDTFLLDMNVAYYSSPNKRKPSSSSLDIRRSESQFNTGVAPEAEESEKEGEEVGAETGEKDEEDQEELKEEERATCREIEVVAKTSKRDRGKIEKNVHFTKENWILLLSSIMCRTIHLYSSILKREEQGMPVDADAEEEVFAPTAAAAEQQRKQGKNDQKEEIQKKQDHRSLLPPFRSRYAGRRLLQRQAQLLFKLYGFQKRRCDRLRQQEEKKQQQQHQEQKSKQQQHQGIKNEKHHQQSQEAKEESEEQQRQQQGKENREQHQQQQCERKKGMQQQQYHQDKETEKQQQQHHGEKKSEKRQQLHQGKKNEKHQQQHQEEKNAQHQQQNEWEDTTWWTLPLFCLAHIYCLLGENFVNTEETQQGEQRLRKATEILFKLRLPPESTFVTPSVDPCA